MGDRGDSDQRWAETWELFHQVVERPAEERGALLDSACGDDTQLRSEVEELLAAHERGLSVLDESPSAALDPTQGSSSTERESGPFEPGTVLAGRFEVLGLIGTGGAGEVYAARDRELGNRVAVKTLLSGLSSNPAALARFRKEILLARQVTHRNACRIFDVFQHQDSIFLTMELLEGETLAARLKRQGRLESDEALAIVEQLVAGLEAAHAVGVVHRDLKPSNVLLVEEPLGLRAVITDFGLATSDSTGSLSREHLTRTGDLVGTPAYMAPEQLEGREVGPATDIYALGLLLYEMVTGRLPFAGSSALSLAAGRLAGPPTPPRSHLPNLDRRWERVILRCLEPAASDRFHSAGEVLAALRGERVPGRRPDWLRWPVVAAAAILVVVVLAWQAVPRLLEERPPTSAAALRFEARDWVLLADFDNRTGEEIFDGSVEAALGRELAGSRFVNVVPRPRVADALLLMQRPQDTRLDPELAREVALRDGGIHAVITGAVERLGPAYVLSADLVDPADGTVVASVSEEAEGLEEVTAAARSLSSRLRRSLGESLPSIRRSERELAAVSTPSLRALQLFTQADQLMSVVKEPKQDEKVRTAVELLREAISEDPTFASAYTHLAWAVSRAAPPPSRDTGSTWFNPEEVLELSQRALELSDRATPVERYFIRGSHFLMTGQLEEALTQYRALLEIDPDHHWANGNTRATLAFLGRHGEMADFAVRAARARPNRPLQSCWAVGDLLIVGRLAEARELAERVVSLRAQVPGYAERWVWLETIPIHELWVQGKIDEVVAALDTQMAAVADRPSAERRGSVFDAVEFYLDLGMFARAEELNALYNPMAEPEWWELKMAWRRWQPEIIAQHLGSSSEMDPYAASERALEFAQVGLAAEAERLLEKLPDEFTPVGGDFPFIPSHYEARLALARGTLAAQAGRLEEAIPLLEEGRKGYAVGMGISDYMLGSETLARVLQELDRPNEAIEVLEEASAQRERMMWRRHYWLRVRLRLLELYRKLGRHTEADAIDRELDGLFSYADDDFPLLVEHRELKARYGESLARAASAGARN